MYIINIQTITASEVINPDAKYKDTDLTNLEFEWLSIKQSERDVIYFKQIDLPNCDSKYYTIENNQVVEMSADQKSVVDANLARQQRIIDLSWLHPERSIRLTIAKEHVKTGGQLESYRNDLFVEKTPYYPDSNIGGFVIVYMEEITPEAEQLLLSLGVTIETL